MIETEIERETEAEETGMEKEAESEGREVAGEGRSTLICARS